MSTNQLLVARDQELARLNSYLKQACAGQGAICFLMGEAGAGKSALLQAFLEQAQATHADLLVAMGTCDAYTGAGDAYLPFREVLHQLMGLASGEVAGQNASRFKNLLRLTTDILAEVGLDLLDTFVPLGAVAKILGKEILKRLDDAIVESDAAPVSPKDVEQGQIFEQYINVLRSLAQHAPIVMVLDDLQWADQASLGLLFRLGRRLAGARIMVAGAYRSDEVALGRNEQRHPLEKVLTELRRYHGDIWLDLDRTIRRSGETFVHAFLDREPNRLRQPFRAALLQHTGGHPLFTIELLRILQERGDLVQDQDGYWIETPALDWNHLPARVEGVLAERVDRLEEQDRNLLAMASVQGEQFWVEVVAEMQTSDPRGLVRMLSGALQRDHRLVQSVGVERLGHQRLSQYRFAHNLIQSYFYTGMDTVERSYLHEDAGLVLEKLYGDDADIIAVQLAWHFEQADLADKACHYLRRAGDQAAARYANDEALDYYTRALHLTPSNDATGRASLLLARERIHDLLGMRERQRADLDAVAKLAADPHAELDPAHQVRAGLRRGWLDLRTGAYTAAIVAAQEALDLLESGSTSSYYTDTWVAQQRVEAHTLWSQTLWQRGDYVAAQQQSQRAWALAEASGDGRGEARALLLLGTIALSQSDPDAAYAYQSKALALTRAIDDRRREWSVLNNLGVIAQSRGEHTQARRHYKDALQVVQSIGHRMGQGAILGNLGEVCLHLGQYAPARAYTEEALILAREVDDRLGIEILLGNLAENARQRGAWDQAREYARESLALALELDDGVGQGIAHNLQAVIHRQAGDHAAALAEFSRARAVWADSEAGHRVLETTVGMAACAMALGDLTTARAEIESLLVELAKQPHGVEDPLPLAIYVECAQVLAMLGDTRAPEVLASARTLLTTRAAAITDPEERYSFQENVLAHRVLLGYGNAIH